MIASPLRKFVRARNVPDRRVLLICPFPESTSGDPLAGISGRKLAVLARLDHDEFMERFDRAVLLPDYDHFDEWPEEDAWRAAEHMRESLRGRRVVFMGALVAEAFGLQRGWYDYFNPVEIPPNIEATVMPSINGISSWWISDENARSAHHFMMRMRLYGFAGKRLPAHLDGDEKRKNQFTTEEIAEALVTGRGIYNWAAQNLSEISGRSVSAQTVLNYVKKNPQLQELRRHIASDFFGTAAQNVIQAVEAGDTALSRWALGTRWAHSLSEEVGARFEQPSVKGEVQHTGQVNHAHMHASLADAGVDVSQYTDDQLEAVEDAMSVLSGKPPKKLPMTIDQDARRVHDFESDPIFA